MLRLYTYDPPGSQYYKPPGQGYLYNTGRYDDSAPAGQGCLSPDSQGFDDLPSLLAYASAHSETLKGPLTRDQVTAICGGSLTYQNGIFVPVSQVSTAGGTGAGAGSAGGGAGSGTTGGTGTPCGTGVCQTGGIAGSGAGGSPGAGAGSGGSGFGSGTLGGGPGGTGGTGGSGGSGGAGGTASATTGTQTGAFDWQAFLKSPMGVLLLVLIIVLLLFGKQLEREL